MKVFKGIGIVLAACLVLVQGVNAYGQTLINYSVTTNDLPGLQDLNSRGDLITRGGGPGQSPSLLFPGKGKKGTPITIACPGNVGSTTSERITEKQSIYGSCLDIVAPGQVEAVAFVRSRSGEIDLLQAPGTGVFNTVGTGGNDRKAVGYVYDTDVFGTRCFIWDRVTQSYEIVDFPGAYVSTACWGITPDDIVLGAFFDYDPDNSIVDRAVWFLRFPDGHFESFGDPVGGSVEPIDINKFAQVITDRVAPDGSIEYFFWDEVFYRVVLPATLPESNGQPVFYEVRGMNDDADLTGRAYWYEQPCPTTYCPKVKGFVAAPIVAKQPRVATK
jgi:hypothetical protein